jgi:AhpD family alkylhydroperoxidase
VICVRAERRPWTLPSRWPVRRTAGTTINPWRIDHAQSDRQPCTHRSRSLAGSAGDRQSGKQSDIPETTLYLVELRASQINSCGVCVDIHTRELEHAGESDERINTVAVWRDVSYFTEAERAALALTEAATRLADRPDPVPDDVWDNAARHYDDAQLAALVLAIAAINAWNRLNVTTRQISGDWVGRWIASSHMDREVA